jgi:hypothetical protein
MQATIGESEKAADTAAFSLAAKYTNKRRRGFAFFLGGICHFVDQVLFPQKFRNLMLSSDFLSINWIVSLLGNSKKPQSTQSIQRALSRRGNATPLIPCNGYRANVSKKTTSKSENIQL